MQDSARRDIGTGGGGKYRLEAFPSGWLFPSRSTNIPNSTKKLNFNPNFLIDTRIRLGYISVGGATGSWYWPYDFFLFGLYFTYDV